MTGNAPAMSWQALQGGSDPALTRSAGTTRGRATMMIEPLAAYPPEPRQP
ncbi:hypothetical protein GGE06_001337 [Streptomyces sp. SFB5A]|uniref:Uncharacterized protein n=1 Tax=Streptomyces nymphaeiformis TaxID=2663842 RepID=A0A7W7TW29_9ACTN|nr:hypothetical protein [Streptomyces nymphaeiformis]